jgi:hypothetical protein
VVGAGGEIEFGARRASGVVTAGEGAVAGAESPEARATPQGIPNRTQLLIVTNSQDTCDRSLPSPAVALLVGVGRILAQDKLLYQAIGEPAPGVDERVGENQSRPAIA